MTAFCFASFASQDECRVTARGKLLCSWMWSGVSIQGPPKDKISWCMIKSPHFTAESTDTPATSTPNVRTAAHLPSVKHVVNKRGHRVDDVGEKAWLGSGVIHFSLLQCECVARTVSCKWYFTILMFLLFTMFTIYKWRIFFWNLCFGHWPFHNMTLLLSPFEATAALASRPDRVTDCMGSIWKRWSEISWEH